MWAIAAAFAFAVALLLDLATLSKGLLDVTTFALIGLFFVALHLAWPSFYPWRSRPRTAA
jgi:hypothetical protein